MEPLVSILIPAHNAEKWIKYTIKSALSQTWQNKEIIIVDDGSSDNTLKIAKQFESKSFKVISQANQGASNARNRALAESQGDFIQWLDADDLLAPDKLMLQLASADRNSRAKVVYTSAWGRFYFRLEKAKFNPGPLWQDLSSLDFLVESFKGGYWMHPTSWLVSRMITDLAGPWDERLTLNDDGEYFFRVVSASNLVMFIPEARCYYRIGNPMSITWNRSKMAFVSHSNAVNQCIDLLLSREDSKTTRNACIETLNQMITWMWGVGAPSNLIDANCQRIIELGGDIIAPVEARTFYCVRNIIGWKRAVRLKTWCWERQESIKMKWDKLLFSLKL